MHALFFADNKRQHDLYVLVIYIYIYIYTQLSPVKIMHENDMHVFGIKQCGIRCNDECHLCQM
jgi:hypothetical protein